MPPELGKSLLPERTEVIFRSEWKARARDRQSKTRAPKAEGTGTVSDQHSQSLQTTDEIIEKVECYAKAESSGRKHWHAYATPSVGNRSNAYRQYGTKSKGNSAEVVISNSVRDGFNTANKRS